MDSGWAINVVLFGVSVFIALLQRSTVAGQCTTDGCAGGDINNYNIEDATHDIRDLQLQFNALKYQLATLEHRLTTTTTTTTTLSPTRQTTSSPGVGPLCTIKLRSYWCGDPTLEKYGYIKSNDVTVATTPHSTGNDEESPMATFVLDLATCNATFDPTYYAISNAVDVRGFRDFLGRQAPGSVLVGASASTVCPCCWSHCVWNDTSRDALNAVFSSVGVDVSDVSCQDRLSFVVVIGNVTATQVDKRSSFPAVMTVTVQATTAGVVVRRLN